VSALEQRQAAIMVATKRREAAAAFKRRLRRMSPWEAARALAVELERGMPDSPGAPIGPLLLAIPLLGDVKAKKLLRTFRLVGGRTVGSLTERRRLELALALRSRAREWQAYEPRHRQSERKAAA
jgi:hypothetical protein